MSDANLFGEPDFELPGVRVTSVGRNAGAEELGATVYELEPGARWAELHAHYANEELAIVIAGRPTVHTLQGSRQLEPGAVVSFRTGRRGAHRFENETDEPARILIVSTMHMPELVEYPERPDGGRLFAMTEPPYTDVPLDEARGRILRVFDIAAGRPVPPDS